MRCPSCQHANPAGTVRCESCGADLAEAIDELEAEIRSLLAQRQKIGAIKIYREATGVGLKEAKDAVEAIERGAPLPATGGDPGDLEDELAELLARGEKIGAIRVYRTRTGAGLKEAKEAVEDLAARRGIVAQGGSGCLGMILLVVAAVGALAWTL